MTAPAYPEATGDKRHYAPPHGWVRVFMPPARFLQLAPPLGLVDEEEDQYIRALSDQIVIGWPLDPPEWSLDHHDGRHRATAAKIAGVKALPVMVPEAIKEWLDEMEFSCDQES